MCVLSCFNRVQLFATPWTVARQVLQSMRFSRQEYWSGLPFPAPTFTLMTVSIKTRDTSTLQKPVVLILISFYKSTFHICFFPIRLPTQLSLGHFILVFANSYSSTDQKTLECCSFILGPNLDFTYTYPLGDLYPLGFPGGSADKEAPAGDARDTDSTRGSGRSHSKGNGNLLQ